MQHPLIVEFFETVDRQLYSRWTTSQGGIEERERLFLEHLGLQAFKDFMHRTMVDGSMAARELEN